MTVSFPVCHSVSNGSARVTEATEGPLWHAIRERSRYHRHHRSLLQLLLPFPVDRRSLFTFTFQYNGALLGTMLGCLPSSLGLGRDLKYGNRINHIAILTTGYKFLIVSNQTITRVLQNESSQGETSSWPLDRCLKKSLKSLN